MNIQRNAEFFIYLAERGLSFAPHTPKRKPDQVGLYREICVLLLARDYFLLPIRKQGQILVIDSSVNRKTYLSGRIRKRSVSPLAVLRILTYFAPVLSDADVVTINQLANL